MRRSPLHPLHFLPAFLVLFLCLNTYSSAQTTLPPSDKLAVVWTSADPEVAHRMVLMYTHAAKTAGWFDEVLLIIWGPSQRLFIEDAEIRNKVFEMEKDGVIVEACIVCAEAYGFAEELKNHGLSVKPMGMPLTEMIKSDWHVLTF